MGPDLELKGRSEIVMEAPTNKENGCVVEEPETKTMRCASNYEDNTFEMEPTLNEQIEEPHRGEDTDVNITECTNSAETSLVQAECQDATESSSSFSNSGSGVHDGGILSDAEVMSEPRGDDTSALAFDGFGDLFRMRSQTFFEQFISDHIYILSLCLYKGCSGNNTISLALPHLQFFCFVTSIRISCPSLSFFFW